MTNIISKNTENLHFLPAIERLDLVSPTIQNLLKNWQGSVPIDEILVAEIDPLFAGGNDLCTKYGVSPAEGATCVIVEATRSSKRTLAACVALVNARMDFNGIIRKALDARRVSLAPLDEVLALSQMEYGSITPYGLPAEWPILLDEKVVQTPRIIIGSGLLRSKLSLPGKVLTEQPSAKIITSLGV